jgi:2-dehydro-3-deoxyphosphooctonate aldolase (KDO 8-P synthase)
MIPIIKNLKYSNSDNFFLIAGPCVIEDEKMAYPIAKHVVELCEKYKIPVIFKASFKKANRTRLDSFTGIGDEKALKILAHIAKEFEIPVVTDIHTADDAKRAAQYVDVLQIPAFLCR